MVSDLSFKVEPMDVDAKRPEDNTVEEAKTEEAQAPMVSNQP